MRSLLFFVLTCIALTAGTWQMAIGQAEDPAESGWHVLHKGMASVEVERTLYEKDGEPHFFIHLRVRNRVDRPIAVDLRDYWRVICPNQWGPLDEDRRGAIDEARLIHRPLDDKQRDEVIQAFRDGRLTPIPAGQAVEYFREFNASGRADVEKQAAGHRFIFISLDGEQIVTDGKEVEQFTCEWKGNAEHVVRELMIPLPIRWKNIPARSIVVSEQMTSSTRSAGR